ncbi:DUF805 domain-containing protein [soil metagenome]
MFDDPMSPMQILFGFRGRIPRKAFWLYGVGALLLFSVMAMLLLGIAGVEQRKAEVIANALLIWPGLAIGVKRWHDRGNSGWWVLINLVPVIGFLVTLVFNGLLRGTPGPNRYGDDPTGQV